MIRTNASPRRHLRWALLGLFLVGGAAFGWFSFAGGPTQKARAAERAEDEGAGSDSRAAESAPAVETVRPRRGGADRSTTQPGSIQAFESIRLFAGVSGYLKEQKVDIGDRVKRGQVLGVIDVPNLEKKVRRNEAVVAQSRAKVTQMESRVLSAKADLEVAQAGIVYAESNAKSKAAELRFREKQLTRMKDLFALKSIDERLVDEKIEQRDTAQEAERAARAAVVSSHAAVSAATAKVAQAEADLVEAQSAVHVAQADLEQQQVIVSFATIKAPCDGVVTQRTLFPGDYVRSADAGSAAQPLLVVQCVDRFRVVVQVPDRDVPWTHPGDPAEVEVDALPGETFTAKVSRIAHSEDPQTRLMHVEIDLPNRDGRISAGMYGRVKIVLQKSDALSIPASSFTGKPEGGRGTVFVVRNGTAHSVPVTVSGDNGVHVAVTSGLSEQDDVVVRPPAGLADGTRVTSSR